MRKAVWLYMLCTLLFCTAACSAETKLKSPVTFNYPRAEYTYGAADSIIAQESRETTEYCDTVIKIISLYLLGPADTTLRSPFPKGTSLISCQQEQNRLHLVLSDELAELTGLELTLACTGLALTCMEITGSDTVNISAESMMLDGEACITIYADSITFLDNVSTDTVTETQAG